MGTRNGWLGVGHRGTSGKYKLDARYIESYIINYLCCISGLSDLDIPSLPFFFVKDEEKTMINTLNTSKCMFKMEILLHSQASP